MKYIAREIDDDWLDGDLRSTRRVLSTLGEVQVIINGASNFIMDEGGAAFVEVLQRKTGISLRARQIPSPVKLGHGDVLIIVKARNLPSLPQGSYFYPVLLTEKVEFEFVEWRFFNDLSV